MFDARRSLNETGDAARAARSNQEIRKQEVGRMLVARAVDLRFPDVEHIMVMRETRVLAMVEIHRKRRERCHEK